MLKRKTSREITQLINEADHFYACLNRPVKALKKIERVLDFSPNHVEALIIKGRILFQLDRLSSAMECFNKAILIDPKCAEGYIERARYLYGIKQENKKALLEVRKALRYAGRGRWVKVYALSLQGDILSSLDRDKEALASYQAALKINPKDEDTLSSLGSTLLGMEQPAKALPYLDKALRELRKERYPDPAILELAFEEKVEALNALAKHKEALKVCEEGLGMLKGGHRSDLRALYNKTKELLEKRS